MKKQQVCILLSSLILWFSIGCSAEIVTKTDEPVDAGNTTGSETVTFEATSVPNTAVPTTPIESTRTIRLTPAATSQIEIVPTTASPLFVEEVPETIMTAVYEDLATSANLRPEAMTITRAEAIVWNDGSLGCPQPGQVYTDATVNGYWIVLEANGRTYDYHAAESGYFILCQSSLPLSPPVIGTPTS